MVYQLVYLVYTSNGIIARSLNFSSRLFLAVQLIYLTTEEYYLVGFFSSCRMFSLAVCLVLLLAPRVLGTIDPLCSFIAATNVESLPFYGQWSCNATGQPVSNPCSNISIAGATAGWNGCNCVDELYIVSISIYDQGLVGTLTPQLGELLNLTSLELYENSLTGSIPPSIGELLSLGELMLYENSLTGSVPDIYSTVLSHCYLDGNALWGTIPPSLGNSHELKYLDLGNNYISGSLPESLGNLTHLLYLDLSSNLLSSALLPALVYQLDLIVYLFLDDNSLSGTLPTFYFGFSHLGMLYMGSNRFSGTLPESLSQSTLRYVDLSENYFNGSMNIFLDVSVIVYMDLSSNSFSGSLPTGNFVYSEEAGTWDLANNKLTGIIPPGIANASKLHTLSLANNAFTGTIPSELCTSTGISLNVSGTPIQCYSGCLTSSAVLVAGASPDCHDGSIMMQFVVISCSVLSGALLCTLLYRTCRSKIRWHFRCFDYLGSCWHSVEVLLPWCAADTDGRSDTPASTRIVRNTVVWIALGKLLLGAIVSFSLYEWWTYSGGSSAPGNDIVIDSCANPKAANCNSYCGNVSTISVNITDDDYIFDPSAITPSVIVEGHNSITSYCVADFRGYCAYDYWLVFKLPPFLLQVLFFFLQCLTLWYWDDFSPQERQYRVIIRHLYPESMVGGNEVDATATATATNNSDNESAFRQPDAGVDSSFSSGLDVGKKEVNITTLEMLEELNCPRFGSVFSFVEMITVVYVWGELWSPPVYCGSVRPLSLYYYPIIMCLLDLLKFNVFVAVGLFR